MTTLEFDFFPDVFLAVSTSRSNWFNCYHKFEYIYFVFVPLEYLK